MNNNSAETHKKFRMMEVESDSVYFKRYLNRRAKSNKVFLGFFTMSFLIMMIFGCNSQRSSLFAEKRVSNKDSNINRSGNPKAFNMLTNYNIKLKELLDSLNLNSSNLHIEIDKSDYTLSILSNTLIIKQYPIVLGDNPVDDKLIEGDRCTPEGTFKVVVKYPHKQWSKFILIDYPNAESLRKFNKAKRNGTIRSDAKIGGEIGIHGVPEGADYAIDSRQNWTLGCISLKNHDINEIYDVVNMNTTVIIRE